MTLQEVSLSLKELPPGFYIYTVLVPEKCHSCPLFYVLYYWYCFLVAAHGRSPRRRSRHLCLAYEDKHHFIRESWMLTFICIINNCITNFLIDVMLYCLSLLQHLFKLNTKAAGDSWRQESAGHALCWVELHQASPRLAQTAASTWLTHQLCKLLDYERRRSRCRRKCDQVQLKTMDRREVLDQVVWSRAELHAEPSSELDLGVRCARISRMLEASLCISLMRGL